MDLNEVNVTTYSLIIETLARWEITIVGDVSVSRERRSYAWRWTIVQEFFQAPYGCPSVGSDRVSSGGIGVRPI